MVLVVGATGHLGRLITRSLLARGTDMCILVRQGSAWESLKEAGAEVCFGDLKSRDTLDAACEGVDVVITTANAAQREGADSIASVDIEGNRNLIDAAASAGIEQFVFVSAFGVGTDAFWDGLLAGRCPLVPGWEGVPTGVVGGLDVRQVVRTPGGRRIDHASLLLLAAARAALADAGFAGGPPSGERVGLALGSSLGNLRETPPFMDRVFDRGRLFAASA